MADFEEAGGFVETMIFDRASLLPGDIVHGPAIIEEPESTIICPPGRRVAIDGQLNALITELDQTIG
jgi:N-methylhydantoinase A